MTSEGKIQADIRTVIKNHGGLSFKVAATSARGLPDLMCIWKGAVFFIEVKTPTGRLSAMQKYRIKQLRDNGVIAEVFDDVVLMKEWFLSEIVH